nr:hypothetical protein [Paracoccus sp. (in: a-proteobacteria)]
MRSGPGMLAVDVFQHPHEIDPWVDAIQPTCGNQAPKDSPCLSSILRRNETTVLSEQSNRAHLIFDKVIVDFYPAIR